MHVVSVEIGDSKYKSRSSFYRTILCQFLELAEQIFENLHAKVTKVALSALQTIYEEVDVINL